MDVLVSVPQSEGEIRISADGDDPVVYPVEAFGERGQVIVAEDQLVRFLSVIDGAEVVEDEAPVTTGDGSGTALPPFTGDAGEPRTHPAFGPLED